MRKFKIGDIVTVRDIDDVNYIIVDLASNDQVFLRNKYGTLKTFITEIRHEK